MPNANARTAPAAAGTAPGRTPRQLLARITAYLLQSSTLLRALRADPLLASLTLVLALAGLAPLFVVRFLPLADLPDNVGAAALLLDAELGRGAAGKYFLVNHAFVPYWSAYVLMGVVSELFGAIAASKFIVGLLVVLLPLVTMRLLIALRRDPRLGLWAFALSWEHNLYYGWVTYLLGMSLAMLALAWLIEVEKPRDTVRIFVLSLIVGLTHIEAVAFLGIAVILLLISARPLVRSGLLICLGASGTLVAIVPWLAPRLRLGSGSAHSASSFSFDWHTPSEKMAKLFEHTLDSIPTDEGRWVTASVFLLALVGPAFLAGLPQFRSVLAPRRGAWVVAVASALLYLTLPMAIGGPIGHWHTYPRFASFLLVGLLFVVKPRLDGRYALALAPGVLAALAFNVATTKQMAAFGKDVAPFQQIVDAVRPNSTVLSLTYNEWHPLFTGFYPFAQLHAYTAGIKHSYDPLLFDNGSIPLVYNPDTRLPSPVWDRPFDYSYTKHGQYYDYIMVQGAKRDPVKVGPTELGQTIRKVVQTSVWTLYAVEPTR
jgi:hypothetical protein